MKRLLHENNMVGDRLTFKRLLIDFSPDFVDIRIEGSRSMTADDAD